MCEKCGKPFGQVGSRPSRETPGNLLKGDITWMIDSMLTGSWSAWLTMVNLKFGNPPLQASNCIGWKTKNTGSLVDKSRKFWRHTRQHENLHGWILEICNVWNRHIRARSTLGSQNRSHLLSPDVETVSVLTVLGPSLQTHRNLRRIRKPFGQVWPGPSRETAGILYQMKNL